MFTALPDLKVLPAPDKWEIVTPLTWQSPDARFTIPAGFITDLASIPNILKNILDVDGLSRSPAIAHDWLYCCQHTTRSFADQVLRKALLEYGESTASAAVYWAGVRLGGWRPWNRRLARGGGLQPDDFSSPEAYTAANQVLDGD